MQPAMIFASVHAVLRWAYGLEGRAIVAQPATFTLGLRSARAWDTLDVWDRHAQSAMVRAEVERLSSPLPELAIALYAPIAVRWPAAQALLGYLDPPAHQWEAYELMIQQYVLGGAAPGRGGINGVRWLLRCRKATALEERRRVFGLLDVLRLRLFAALEPGFVRAGLVAVRAEGFGVGAGER